MTIVSVAPTPLVLDYIQRCLAYDPLTGIVSKNGKPLGTKRKKTNHMVLTLYLDTTYEGCRLMYSTYVHHVAWYLTHKEWPSLIDHADGDPANNKLANLRLASRGQNTYNQRKRKGILHSQYKGVTKVGEKWRAVIHHQGKAFHLGYHLTEVEAALAYDAKAEELFGSFARLNLEGSPLPTSGASQNEGNSEHSAEEQEAIGQVTHDVSPF